MSDNPTPGHQPDGQPDDEHRQHHNGSNDHPADQHHDGQHHDGQHPAEEPDRPSGDQTGAGADGHPGNGAGRGYWSAAAIPVPRSGPDDTGLTSSDVDPAGVGATSAGPGGVGSGAGSGDPSGADAVGDTTGGWSMSLLRFDPEDSLVVIGFAGREVHSMAFSTLRNLNPYATTQLSAVWAAYQEVIDSDKVEIEAVSVVGYLAPDDIVGWHALVGVQALCPLPVRDVILITPVRWWILNCPAPDPAACSASAACGPDGALVTLTGLPDPTTVHRLVHGGARPHDEAVPGIGGLWSLPIRDGSARSPYLTRGLHAPGDTGRFDAALSPGYTPTREAVATHLPLRPTGDPGTNQVVLRNLLAQQHHTHRSPSPAVMRAEMTAALLQALADDQLAHACLAWRDRAAWGLYLALVRDAPAGWAAPVWTLIAAHAYVRGHFATARTAIDRALADRPDQPGRGLVAALSYGLDYGVTPGWMAVALDELIDQVPTHLRHDLPWNRRGPGSR